MKAMKYMGPRRVRVEDAPEPIIEHPMDVIVKVKSACICGSDLHIYHGRIPGMRDGDILGHEFMGIVEETGAGVTRVKAGDRVVIPFVIACGTCFHCQLHEYAACETTNSGPGAAMNPRCG